MKILAFHPVKLDGTNWYRGLGPLFHLQRMYPDIEIIDTDDKTLVAWTSLMAIDIVFLQRPSSEHEITIMKIAKKSMKSVWIDYDDDYFNIPVTNPRYELYHNETRLSMIKECLSLADIISVSTPSLGYSLSRYVEPGKIRIVPNAYDDTLFSAKKWEGERNKVVVWRGGDTHEQDLLSVKDQLIRLIKKHTDYKWAFMGYCPLWLSQDLEIQHQLILYDFMDINYYFEILMQLRPEIVIVPLEFNAFNESKSNISWIEGTLSGAVTLAPDMDKFQHSSRYTDPDGFEKSLEHLISDSGLRNVLYEQSLKYLPSLYDTNKIRYGIGKELMESKKYYEPRIPTAKHYTDQEVFEYALKRGYIQENAGYANGHHKLAEWLKDRCNAETAVEFGCGPGATLERLLTLNVRAYGLDINGHMIDYFQQRNPVFSEYAQVCDFTKEFQSELVCDLGISIEVFEHISMPEADWDRFITMLAKNFRWFYFTSTPYHTTEEFDQRWGHINIRRYEKWVELFVKNGWDWVENPKNIVAWDMLLKSRLADVKETNLEIVK